MKTLKLNFAVVAFAIGYLATGCANRSNPEKVAFQNAADKHYQNMTTLIQSTKRAVSGGSRQAYGTTNSNMYYPTSGSNWNGGVYVPQNGTYMQSNIQAEIQQCQSDVNAIPKKYAKQRIVLLHQCLQVALQYRNSFNTRMYANTTDSTQNMWQYSAFAQYPGQYQYYQQDNAAYSWLNQFLSQGYVPTNVTYSQYGR